MMSSQMSQPIAGSSSQASLYSSNLGTQNGILHAPYAPPDLRESQPSSMTQILLEPLDQLQHLTQQLFQSLSSTQARPIPPPSPADFLAVDAALAAATQLARKHQVKQRKIERLKNEVLMLDGKWRETVESLEHGKRELDNIISEGEERIKAIEEAKSGAIPYPELLAYAQSLSAFTSAPPNMPDMTQPGQPPPPLFFPPFPNEEKMRRGHMNNEEPLGLLGETHSVGKPPTISPPKSPGYTQIGGPTANPYRPDQRGPQTQIFDLDLDLNPDL